MKTYDEYLQEIKKREYDKRQKEIEEQKRDGRIYISVNAPKMTFDYSVEIMGMMMQDFIEDISSVSPFRFDEEGNLRVTER